MLLRKVTAGKSALGSSKRVAVVSIVLLWMSTLLRFRALCTPSSRGGDCAPFVRRACSRKCHSDRPCWGCICKCSCLTTESCGKNAPGLKNTGRTTRPRQTAAARAAKTVTTVSARTTFPESARSNGSPNPFRHDSFSRILRCSRKKLFNLAGIRRNGDWHKAKDRSARAAVRKALREVMQDSARVIRGRRLSRSAVEDIADILNFAAQQKRIGLKFNSSEYRTMRQSAAVLIGELITASPDVVDMAQASKNSSAIVVSSVESVGVLSPPLPLINKLYAHETTAVAAFSQTIADINTTAHSINGEIVFDFIQNRSLRMNEANHSVNIVMKGKLPAGSQPLLAVGQEALQALNCTWTNDYGCTQRLQFNVYTNGALFQEVYSGSNSSDGLDSFVVGVKLGDYERVSKKRPFIRLSFRPFTDATGKTESHHCVFWDFAANGHTGGWSTDGCVMKRDRNINRRITCLCTHLTNFAVLLSSNVDTSKSLEYSSIVGLSLSSIGLFATVVFHLAIRKLRKDMQSRIVVGLSANLLCLNLVVVLGAKQTAHKVWCEAVAILLHYFLLSSFGWMMVDAVFLYLKIVRVFNSHVPHFVQKAFLFSQGYSLLLVVITASAAFNDYSGSSFCRLSIGLPFYLSTALPLSIAMVISYTSYACVQHQLMKQPAADDHRSARQAHLRSSLRLGTLTGLTWVFGILLLIESHTIVQWFFFIFVTTQGISIFFFQVLMHRKLCSFMKEARVSKAMTRISIKVRKKNHPVELSVKGTSATKLSAPVTASVSDDGSANKAMAVTVASER